MHIMHTYLSTAGLFDKAENLMKRYNITLKKLLTCNTSRALIPTITEKARKYVQTGWEKTAPTLLRIIKPLVTPQKTPISEEKIHICVQVTLSLLTNTY